MSEAPTTSATEAQKAVFDAMRARLDACINECIREAHHQIRALLTEGDAAAREQHAAALLAEVLREIATRAVEVYTQRTGQPFWWVDEPEIKLDEPLLMEFRLDEKGNVVFG